MGPAGQDSTVPGPAGPMGETGPPISSFTFDWANTTWICTDPDGDLAYDCEPTQSNPNLGLQSIP